MNNLRLLLSRVQTRPALIGVVVMLLLLNLGRFATGRYQEFRAGIESKQALLGQYRMSTSNLESLRKRVQRLETQKNRFDAFLFTGASRKEITSEMQIKIQELLGQAGLSPESLRPTGSNKQDEDKLYGEVVVKVRINGNLKAFVDFLSALYRLNYLFKIENFTLKPFKKTELKVFLELKGFYKLSKDANG